MRKSRLIGSMLLACILMLVSCGPKSIKITFDQSKEMPGAKIALKDINPDLPKDWDNYKYVLIEYRISTAQRFQLGFTTDDGYSEARVMCYVPKAWNRLAIPLKYFTQLPDPESDLAATYNHPRYMGWINLLSRIGPLHGVDSIGVRMRKPIGNQTFEIRKIELSMDDPGDAYLEEVPAIDSLGQNTFMDYPEKVASLDELRQEWEAEDAEQMDTAIFSYSKFGGYRDHQVKGTGFFRVEKIDGRWWFVDPEGYLFLSVGVDCVSPGGGGSIRDYDKRANMYQALPPESLFPVSRRSGEVGYSLGTWNLFRRYGEDYEIESRKMIQKRMEKWGLNTIANWSDPEVISMNEKAFMISLDNVGAQPELMGLADVYEPGFEASITRHIQGLVSEYIENPWLIGYFIGNEPAWIDHEIRLSHMISEGPDRPIKSALNEWLIKKGDSEESRQQFIFSTFEIYLSAVNRVLKETDGNHLNLGIRFGNINDVDDRILSICGKYFDVFSFNCYALKPDDDGMKHAEQLMNIPLIIGEYHFGTVDRGLAQSLWQVESQEQRGVAYRYYTEQAYSNPALIGTGYFQWCDQDITGRFDGENYNCGLIDVTDRPYREMVSAVKATSEILFKIHSGEEKPFSEVPENARGHELGPDLWQ
jgi:hypothetical protein